MWKTVRLHGKKLQNATKILTAWKHTETEITIQYYFQRFRDFSTEPDSKQRSLAPTYDSNHSKGFSGRFLMLQKKITNHNYQLKIINPIFEQVVTKSHCEVEHR